MDAVEAGGDATAGTISAAAKLAGFVTAFLRLDICGRNGLCLTR